MNKMSIIKNIFRLRLAKISEQEIVSEILQNAIIRRKKEGSSQWQDGYPNEETVLKDFASKEAFVLTKNEEIVAYVALIFDKEPAYETGDVIWITTEKYAVVHRAAVSEKFLGQGMATMLFTKIEEFVKSKGVFSIKVDTNFDNFPMLKIFENLNYKYCGEVFFRGSARKAFEKVLH